MELGIAGGGVEISRISLPVLNQMGISKGDVILQVGSQPVNSVAAFNKALSGYKSGDRVRLLIQNAESTGIHILNMP